MKKLNKEDKKVLIENQKYFYEENKAKPQISNFQLHLWFHKLNRYAKKYNIDLIAIPHKEWDDYSYQIDLGKVNRYKPIHGTNREIWSYPKRAMQRIHLSAPAGRKVEKAVLFIMVPYCKTGRIVRKNIYKDVGPSTICDYAIMKTSEA